jgi:cobalt-zinc-cadmium efflux system membrane fusion protein
MNCPRIHWHSALLFAITVAGCERLQAPQAPPTHELRKDGAVVLNGGSAAFVKVETVQAATSPHSRTLVARVAFDERRLATIGPPVSGRVANVEVVTGDKVKKGDILLTIHSPDIASVQAQVAESRSARILAGHTLKRTESLVHQGAASQAELQQAQAQLQQAVEEERRATSSLAAVGGGDGSADYHLRSPIDGIVVERQVAVGREVNVGQDQPLLSIADLSKVWVIADLYEQDLSLVKADAPAVVFTPALPGQKFPGRIVYVGDLVDSTTRAIRTRIEIDNPNNILRPGMFAQAVVETQSSNAVDVPVSAVLARRDQFFVFIQAADGSYHQKEVKLGEQQGAHVTLIEGVKPGDKLVTQGAILLDAEANEAL